MREPCGVCGMPYHRFADNDPEHDHSYTACINALQAEIERLTAEQERDDLFRVAQRVVVAWLYASRPVISPTARNDLHGALGALYESVRARESRTR